MSTYDPMGIFVLWFIFVITWIGGAILILIAVWRSVKAHEALTSAIQDIAETIKTKSNL